MIHLLKVIAQRLFPSFLLCWSSCLWAISEADYKAEYASKVKPFWEQGEEGTLEVRQGINLAYKVFPHPRPKGHMIILEGWAEPMRKYAEIAYDLHQAGMALYFFDWRGQGLSSRLLADSQKSFILDYQDYVEDLEKFLSQVVRKKTDAPLVVLAHSMGANILSLYAVKHPQDFPRLILASPMLDLKTGWYPEWLAWFIAKGFELAGQGSGFLFGHGHYDGKDVNTVTTSTTRRNNWVEYKDAHREVIISGATFSWIRASLEATWYMKKHAKDLSAPILMLQAGDDLYVETEGQDTVCQGAVHCKKLIFPKARHEILNEVDSIRESALQEIITFSTEPGIR